MDASFQTFRVDDGFTIKTSAKLNPRQTENKPGPGISGYSPESVDRLFKMERE
jgi:hypothetical protein